MIKEGQDVLNREVFFYLIIIYFKTMKYFLQNDSPIYSFIPKVELDTNLHIDRKGVAKDDRTIAKIVAPRKVRTPSLEQKIYFQKEDFTEFSKIFLSEFNPYGFHIAISIYEWEKVLRTDHSKKEEVRNLFTYPTLVDISPSPIDRLEKVLAWWKKICEYLPTSGFISGLIQYYTISQLQRYNKNIVFIKRGGKTTLPQDS